MQSPDRANCLNPLTLLQYESLTSPEHEADDLRAVKRCGCLASAGRIQKQSSHRGSPGTAACPLLDVYMPLSSAAFFDPVPCPCSFLGLDPEEPRSQLPQTNTRAARLGQEVRPGLLVAPPAAWLGAVALRVPLILHQCIVARPSGQAERDEQPFHISCIQCHANTIPAPQPEGWKLRRWQYERLIEVVRPDAAR